MNDSDRIVLASFPRSGNTWVRYLLKYYTGLTPTSVYKPGVSSDHNKTPFLKTHDHGLENYGKIIHIIRHPMDCIPSFSDYQTSFGRQNSALDSKLSALMAKWEHHTRYVLRVNKPKITIKYEDLIDDTAHELCRMLEFSGIPIVGSKVQEAVEKSSFENLRSGVKKEDRIEWEKDPTKFFGVGKAGVRKSELSDNQRMKITNRLGHIMKLVGYEP